MKPNRIKMKITKSKLLKSILSLMAALLIMIMLPITASAHCDTMDGPTVVDGKKAMAENNINYALKWVQPDYEEEITHVFNLSMKVKDLDPNAKEIAEQYFFSELVRMHRAGEGAPFTGLKPSGTPIDDKVLAADESIAVGNLSPLENLIEEGQKPELEERFENVMAKKDFDVNDVEAGREYIEAYVKFFKFAEGEEDHEGAAAHGEDAASTVAHVDSKTNHTEASNAFNWLPWSLAGLFLVTTIVSHVKLFMSKK